MEQKSRPSRAPETVPLMPHGELARVAHRSRLLLCLDYDGTLAEITAEPSLATPLDGVPESLMRIAAESARVAVAIVTGRRIEEVKALLGVEQGLFYSGLHGMELRYPDGRVASSKEAAERAHELDALRNWLAHNVPSQRGFRVEDKGLAIGLHYRQADPGEAAVLAENFARFVAAGLPGLRVLRLKMLIEALPRMASKAEAIVALREARRDPHVTVFIGDDATDEDAFGVLEGDDFGVVVGGERKTLARYRLAAPSATAAELAELADELRHG